MLSHCDQRSLCQKKWNELTLLSPIPPATFHEAMLGHHTACSKRGVARQRAQQTWAAPSLPWDSKSTKSQSLDSPWMTFRRGIRALVQIHGFHWKQRLHDVCRTCCWWILFGDRALAGQWPWTSEEPMDEEVHAAVRLEKPMKRCRIRGSVSHSFSSHFTLAISGNHFQ